MSCARTRQMLDALIDQELDAATSAELAHHLSTCPACNAMRADREALRKNIKTGATYFNAPASLRSAVTRELAAVENSRTPLLRRSTSWWQTTALAISAAIASSLLTVWMLRAPAESALPPWPEQAVAQHVAGLSDPQRMIEVTSTDRHTIKPWFHGKVDFAPTVADLSAEGFVLSGARLERLEHQPAAALVYQLREHPVSLFMTRATIAEPMTIKIICGFSVATWVTGGVRFVAVADTDVGEIKRFAGLVQALH